MMMMNVLVRWHQLVVRAVCMFDMNEYVCCHRFGSAFFCSKEGGANTFVYIVYVQVIGVW